MEAGGGIYNSSLGDLAVRNTSFSGNAAFAGAGIFNEEQATVIVANSTFTDNDGGGIQNRGVAEVTRTTFSRNQFSVGGGGSVGGGISNFGVLNVTDSIITENSAGRGGGIFTANGSVSVTRTRIDGNDGTGGGGGGILLVMASS